MKRIICLVAIFIACGCATAHDLAIECDPERRNFTVEVPADWKQLNSNEFFIITRENPFSQYILFRQRHVNEHFPHTTKGLYKNMPQLEVADVIIDEMKCDPSVVNLQVTETAPASVGSYPGFKIVFDYGIKEGYTFNTIYYGLLHGEWLYSIRYNAAPDAFSEKDVEDFVKVLKSFRCKG